MGMGESRGEKLYLPRLGPSRRVDALSWLGMVDLLPALNCCQEWFLSIRWNV